MYSGSLASWAIDRGLKSPARAASSQTFFARQFQSRLETSRALSLPQYGCSDQESQMIKTELQWETSMEQELMYVVSTLTTRSENFVEMSRHVKSGMVTSNKFRVLEDIVF